MYLLYTTHTIYDTLKFQNILKYRNITLFYGTRIKSRVNFRWNVLTILQIIL